jgi:hypothetical protein
LQATLSTTRILDRRGVRALLDIIASSSEFRREMHKALAVYDVVSPAAWRASAISKTEHERANVAIDSPTRPDDCCH